MGCCLGGWQAVEKDDTVMTAGECQAVLSKVFALQRSTFSSTAETFFGHPFSSVACKKATTRITSYR